MKKTLYTIPLLALSTSAFAATVTDYGSIEQDDAYSARIIAREDTTVSYDSIKSGGVAFTIIHAGSTAVNFEIGSIDVGSGDVNIQPKKGNIQLGDVQAGHIAVSTNGGNITLTGNISAADASSGFYISGDDGALGGSIILDGATLSNVELRTVSTDASGNVVAGGMIEISGNTTLSNVFISAGELQVAEGANLVVDGVIFASRGETSPENPDIVPTYAGLSLGDNATLTLKGDQPLVLSSLSVGSGVSFVVELSDEDFANLDDSEFTFFDVEEGNIDLSGVAFTFTNGTEAKSGTITAGSGGSITVTNTYSVPEPATATLSLLALVGLCARRRRA